MTAAVAAILALALLVGLLAVAAYQRGRLAELTFVAGCMAGDHDWQLLTGGRAGFVRWYHCQRLGCDATRFVKGTER